MAAGKYADISTTADALGVDAQTLTALAAKLRIPIEQGAAGPRIPADRYDDLAREAAVQRFLDQALTSAVAAPADGRTVRRAPSPAFLSSSDSGLFSVDEIAAAAAGLSGAPASSPTTADGEAPERGAAVGSASQRPTGVPAAPAEAAPLAVGPLGVLLFDEKLFQQSVHVVREWHRPVKRREGPVLMPDSPWETGGCLGRGLTVLFDPDDRQFKMWYDAQGRCGPTAGYAVSPDGVQWVKPLLDVHPWQGAPTNIVMGGPGMPDYRQLLGVTRDPAGADKSRPRLYRAAYIAVETGPAEIRTATSPDGVHWTAVGKAVSRFAAGPGSLTMDEKTGRWVVNACLHTPSGPAVCLSESSDFAEWSEPVPVPGLERPVRRGAVARGLSPFHHPPYFVGLSPSAVGTEDSAEIHLVVSEDGRRWERPTAEPFLACGPIGDWDLHGVTPACGGLFRFSRRELRFYYGGRIRRERPDGGPAHVWGAIGMATLRSEGFLSLNGRLNGGVLITRLVTLASADLLLNVQAPFGMVYVEVLDETGKIMAASVPTTGDSTELAVNWKPGTDTAPLAGRPVRLRFVLNNAKLFGFRAG